ncbi:MAG: phospholipid carrier-dependent glycosyltransferase, partial [Verrucomicrobiota bacterium]|nr:phospholipid carrier-dependent glycosyltransferase [Verrucomicrobiota bacterium]
IYVVTLCLVLAAGTFLRLPPSLFENSHAPLSFLSAFHPNPGFMGIGFDESLYRSYVNSVIRGGLGDYPAIVDRYIEVQKTLVGSILPPMRFLYIFSAYLWHQLFGTEALAALHDVASFFSILTLFLAAIFAWRLQGREAALAVSALMAFAPTQVHMSQHALVDGFFAFWALLTLWMLWENLHAPHDWRWLAPYTLGLACLVITKENAAFVAFAAFAIIAANRWLKWGVVTRELLACTLIGGLLGFVILVFLAGGVETLRTTYQLSVSKNYHLVYAIMTGDGPWHRYLVDLLLVSPVVLLLALGAVFRLDRTQKPELFLAVFVGASYLVMCNLKYGMNLRYANMWDMPLRVLAFSQLRALVQPFTRYRGVLLATAVALICAVEMRQYLILFVDFPLYELVSEGLLRALQILKSAPAP